MILGYNRQVMEYDTPYEYDRDELCMIKDCGKPGYAIYRHHLKNATWGRLFIRCEEHHQKWCLKHGQKTPRKYDEGGPKITPTKERGESVTTGYEVQMYNDISIIAQSLRKIASLMEAAEKRATEAEEVQLVELRSSREESGVQVDMGNPELGGDCDHADCPEPVIAMVNNIRYCEKHIDSAFARISYLLNPGGGQ